MTLNSFFLLSVLLFSTSTAPALIDLDDDQLSDLWERQYGFSTSDDGTLYPEQAADFDKDGDGHTNLEESRAGTDPNSPSLFNRGNSTPAGKFGLELSKNETTECMMAHFWAVKGKKYEIYVSDTLTGWAPAGTMTHNDTSGEMTMDTNVSTANETKKFWRLEVVDHDQDGDSLTNYEEALLGTNMMASMDSDGDDLPDEWEQAVIGDLAQGKESDSDGDGIKAFDEYRYGLDPTQDDTQKTTGKEVYQYDFTRLTGANKTGGLRLTFRYDNTGNLIEVTP